jgi:NTE family protein
VSVSDRPRAKTAPFSLALGGGGARGLAHVGVLRVLEREGLRPRAIAGTSMGSIVGALYAAGVDADDLAATLDLLDLKGVAGVTKFNLKPDSVLSADAFEARIREVLPATFDELQIPFAAVAADLITGDRVVITAGDLPRAVRASMSIPVVFEPVRIGEHLFVDGGIVDPVPVDAARQIGGDPVMAVDVGPLAPPGSPGQGPRGSKPLLNPESPTVVQVGTRAFDVASHWLSRSGLATAAAVIAPDVSSYSMADFLDGPAIIAEGLRAAGAAMPEVRTVLQDAARTPLQRWWRGLLGD